MSIALLSNINMNAAIRLLKRNLDVYESEGYGNELGTLFNTSSSIYTFKPDIIFLIEDLMELIGHKICIESAKACIIDWFSDIRTVIDPSIIYYISDAYLWGPELDIIVDKGMKRRIENIWQENLEKLLSDHHNIRIFPYHHLIELNGENSSFSPKMWYMGRILHSNQFQRIMCDEIIRFTNMESSYSRKVLLLDLDNTLWGGLAGEDDITPIDLSDEHSGLAYKNLQRIILQMKNQGVILGIVSKNNESDVMPIINEHPHMILKSSDFAIMKINWNQKNINIVEIASELNIGLDSIVFFDDNPTERQLIKELIPEVIVPDFPSSTDVLPDAMVNIWKTYFERPTITNEDINKTEQYIANAKRNEYRIHAGNFNDYLQGLDITLTRVNEEKHIDRITQLLNKTNQFNLTTTRHSQNEIQEYMDNNSIRIYAFHEKDRFGDNGKIAVVIVDVTDNSPSITDFVMSCRVMGKNIEYAILDFIENDILESGFATLHSKYIKTSKNTPVESLYDSLGYIVTKETDMEKSYIIKLSNKTKRSYCLTIKTERN